MSDIIEFTPAVISKIREILADQKAEDQYLRVAAEVSPEGRLSHSFGLDRAAQAEDEVIEGDIKVLVDQNSVELIRGSSIDYVDSFERSGFVVSNPNAQGGCPCGGGGCGCR